MEEIKIGFLRGIGFFLAMLFIGIITIISILIFIKIRNIEFELPKFNKGECISYNYKNGKKVCAAYEND